MRVTIKSYSETLSDKYVNTLEEILKHFLYRVTFQENKIHLISESYKYKQTYEEHRAFIHDWIKSLMKIMEFDKKSDYLEWIVTLREYMKNKN